MHYEKFTEETNGKCHCKEGTTDVILQKKGDTFSCTKIHMDLVCIQKSCYYKFVVCTSIANIVGAIEPFDA